MTTMGKQGICDRFRKKVFELGLCDYYEPRRKGRYKTRCKNCKKFRLPHAKENIMKNEKT